jgi:protein-S-isoprenylcysteine O-methyltransferase Ste14
LTFFLTVVIFMAVSFLAVALKYQTKSYFRLPVAVRTAASLLHALVVLTNICLYGLLCAFDYASLDLPLALRAAGTLLALPGIYLILAGVAALKAKLFFPVQTDRLVTGGFYGLVRHPMYLGGIAGSLGIALAAASRFALYYTGVLAVVLYAVSRLEERDLAQRFGPGFEEYRRRVPALMPTPGSLARFIAGRRGERM